MMETIYVCKRCGLQSAYISELTCSECLRDTRLLNLDVEPINVTAINVTEADLLDWKMLRKH
jgi:hypothetical protein